MNRMAAEATGPPRIREEQQRLYEAVKGDPATKDLPVAVSSLANLRDSPAKLGDLTPYLDFGNMHPYAAGNPPSRHWGWGLSMERAIAEARKVSGDKPILVTECGYHNRMEEQGHPGVSEAAEAKYLPRLFFVYFNRGMTKAYKYELLDLKPDPGFTDLERHFGLVRTNGAPKPSFLALKNLLHLLADPGPAAQSGLTGFPTFGSDQQRASHTPAKARRHVLAGPLSGSRLLRCEDPSRPGGATRHRNPEAALDIARDSPLSPERLCRTHGADCGRRAK